MDRPVEEGDTVSIDFVGKKDGVAFEGGSAENFNLIIGSGAFVDGFEDGLIGARPGETVELDVTFPEDYDATELAGKAVVFTVKVRYIVPDEMEDSVVAAFGAEEYATVEELRQYTRTRLEEYYQVAYWENVERTIYSRIYSNSTYQKFPEHLLIQRIENVRASIEADAKEMNMDVDTLISSYYDLETESFLEQVAKSYLKHTLTAYAIAEKENILQTAEELSRAIEQLAAEKGFASMEEMLQSGYTKDDLEEQAVVEAVFEFLLENTNITRVNS